MGYASLSCREHFAMLLPGSCLHPAKGLQSNSSSAVLCSDAVCCSCTIVSHVRVCHVITLATIQYPTFYVSPLGAIVAVLVSLIYCRTAVRRLISGVGLAV